MLCAWSYELILFLCSTKMLQVLCFKYHVLSYKIYSPGLPCARMHYGAVFGVLNVVGIEVKALNLLGSDAHSNLLTFRWNPLSLSLGWKMAAGCYVRKFPLGYSMSASFRLATACRQVPVRLQHVGKFPLGYSMSASSR